MKYPLILLLGSMLIGLGTPFKLKNIIFVILGVYVIQYSYGAFQ